MCTVFERIGSNGNIFTSLSKGSDNVFKDQIKRKPYVANKIFY